MHNQPGDYKVESFINECLSGNLTQYKKIISELTEGAFPKPRIATLKKVNNINKSILFGTVYGRSAEQQQEAIKRYENVSKEYFDIPKQLSRWFNEDYLSKNPNESQLVSTILENNDHHEFLKSYKLFSHFEDNMILFNQILAPTLIVTGENEVGSTPEMSKKIGEIVKDSKVEIIPNGKHMCGMECADKVNQVFGNFLNDS